MTSRTSRRRARAGGRQTFASYQEYGLIDDTPSMPKPKPKKRKGPNPNANAVEHANENAKFKRT